MIKSVIPCLMVLACLAGAGCKKSDPVAKPFDSTYYNRIKFIVDGNSDYRYFADDLNTVGLLDTLASPGVFTLLLSTSTPTNRNRDSYLYEAPADQILKYQVLPGAHTMSGLPVAINQELPTFLGTNIFVSRYVVPNGSGNGTDTVTTINGKNILLTDVAASNGVIQVVEDAPLPLVHATLDDALQNRQETRILAAIFQRLNLRSILQDKGPYTLLAPTDQAFINDPDFTYLSLKNADDVYAADTALLAALVRNLVIPGRMFLNDFNLNYQATGQSVYPTLGGGQISVAVTPDDYHPHRYSSMDFSGSGNAAPVTVYAPAFISASGIPAGNGVLIPFSGVLVP